MFFWPNSNPPICKIGTTRDRESQGLVVFNFYLISSDIGKKFKLQKSVCYWEFRNEQKKAKKINFKFDRRGFEPYTVNGLKNVFEMVIQEDSLPKYVLPFVSKALERVLNWYKLLGTIHILRQHIFGLFWTYPPTMSVSINTVLNVRKNGHFLNPPSPYTDVIYGLLQPNCIQYFSVN